MKTALAAIAACGALAIGIAVGNHNSKVRTHNDGFASIPAGVINQVRQGNTCTLEPDFNDRTGEVYAGWYC